MNSIARAARPQAHGPDASQAAQLFARLRVATSEAHQGLETALDLLRPPLSKARFVAGLEILLGFHRPWERALDALPGLAPLREGRARIALLEQDLVRLGRSPAAIAAAPQCAAAADLATSLPRAAGSLYVMEGSTLGGRVISRALADTAWAPAAGLGYFNPYGEATGVMWRRFQIELHALIPPEAHLEVEQGAVDTFARLTAWATMEAAA